jgi:predicted nucleic-acid-binding protein
VTGFDTNVLVRYLVRDDADQEAVVFRLITDAAESGVSVYLNKVVVCETVWVLESAYEYPKDTIADVLEKLLLTQQFEFEERDHVWRSLRRYRDGKADLADYLIGETNHAAGCDDTATFDRALRGEDGFTVLS